MTDVVTDETPMAEPAAGCLYASLHRRSGGEGPGAARWTTGRLPGHGGAAGQPCWAGGRGRGTRSGGRAAELRTAGSGTSCRVRDGPTAADATWRPARATADSAHPPAREDVREGAQKAAAASGPSHRPTRRRERRRTCAATGEPGRSPHGTAGTSRPAHDPPQEGNYTTNARAELQPGETKNRGHPSDEAHKPPRDRNVTGRTSTATGGERGGGPALGWKQP